ncbi:hypothetical protein [Pseudomonas sp. NCCP-436]|uniref:hypothetical protein n=1 Tax=Pseudomonas sp. NCCP-436 TaxID=2842481 RepID=UPI001C819A32|nr:hypothetical protein [Pseudomonas sp. NCCP-436]
MIVAPSAITVLAQQDGYFNFSLFISREDIYFSLMAFVEKKVGLVASKVSS